MKRACDVCSTRYEARRSTSRYCSTKCRTRASRTGKTTGAKTAAVVPMPSAPTGDLESATVSELETAGRLETARGQAVVLLARRIDSTTADSGSSYAALLRQWDSALEKATAGTGTEKSALDLARDELAARRAKRGA